MEKYFIFVNPKSGKGASIEKGKQLRDGLVRQGKKATLYFSQDILGGLGPFYEDQYSDLVIIGGDGTINLAVTALKNFETVLSVIPAGTGNDFVKNLALGRSFEHQASLVTNGPVKSIDVGNCNGRKFLNGVGIGFDGQIVKDMMFNKTILSKNHHLS